MIAMQSNRSCVSLHKHMQTKKHWSDSSAAQAVGTAIVTIIGIGLISIPFFLIFAVVPAYFEASAFNRLTTGPKVSVFDAVFLDLRIEAK